MKTLKKLIASVSALLVVFSATANIAAASHYSDVSGHWVESDGYLDTLLDVGVLDASKSTFRPDESINRAELVKMVMNYDNGGTDPTVDDYAIPSTPTFSDVATGNWFYNHVEAAASIGVVDAAKENFRPSDNITRAEALKVITLGLMVESDNSQEIAYSDVNEGDWYYSYVKAAYNNCIIKSADKFRPGDAITRAEAAKIFAVSMSPNKDCFSTATPTPTGSETPTPTETAITSDGKLEVTLSKTSPLSATLPGEADGVELGKFDFAATGDDVLLQSLVIHRGGLGSDGVLTSVVVFDEMGRVSKSKTINTTTDEATVSFLGGGVLVKAGTVKTLTIKGTLGNANNSEGTITSGDTYNGSEFSVEIASAGSVVANTLSVSGSFPVRGNLMKLGATDAAVLEINDDGAPSDPKLGAVAADVTKFKLKNTDSQNAIQVRSLTLKEDASIDEETELVNYKLYIEGTEVAVAAKAYNKYVTFNLVTPYNIKSSDTVKALVKADVVGGAGDYIAFKFESDLDVTAVDVNKGYGAGINTDGYNNRTTFNKYDPAAASELKVQAGEVTLTSVEPTLTDVLKDKDNIVAGGFKLIQKAGKNLEIQKVTVSVTATKHTGATLDDVSDTIGELIENVEIRDTNLGTVYDLASISNAGVEIDVTSPTTATYADLDLSIPVPGDKEFEIRFDTKNVADIADVDFTFAISSIGGAGFTIVETTDDKLVTDIIPSSITWKKLTGTASSATLSVLTLSSVKNAVIGTAGVEGQKFEVKAGSASKLIIDEVKVSGVVANDPEVSVISNKHINKLSLYRVEGTVNTLLDETSGSQIAAGVATFDGFKSEIEANKTATYLVTYDVVDDETKTGDTIQLALKSLSIDDYDSDAVDAVSVGSETLCATNLPVTYSGSACTAVASTASNYTSTRTTTIKGVGTLAVATDNTDPATDKSKYVLGGTESDFVASYELTATNEGVSIRDLSIVETSVATEAQVKAALAEVVLYKADGKTVIARKSVTGKSVDFADINYTIAEGSENIYVAVVAQKQGKDQAGAITYGLQFALKVTDADGASSNKTIKGDDGTAIAVTNPVTDNGTTADDSSFAFATIPTSISNVEFVNSYGGYAVGTKLTNGSNTLAILKVTTSSSSNTDATDGTSLKTVLSTLSFKFDTDATVDGATGVTVEKINGTGDYTADVAVAGTVATVNLAANTTDTNQATAGIGSVNAEIDPGTTVYYAIKANVSGLTDATQKYAQVSIVSLDAGDIGYKSDDADGLEAAAAARAALYIKNLSKIEAVKVSQ